MVKKNNKNIYIDSEYLTDIQVPPHRAIRVPLSDKCIIQ